MRWLHVSALLSLAACGGEHNQHTGIDGNFPDTSNIDALPSGCDYVELHDATNDDVYPAPGTPETTGLTVGAKTTICGAFQHTHYDGSLTVDVDGYLVQVASDTDLVVRLGGAGVGAIEYAGVDVYGQKPGMTAYDQHLASVTVYGDHGVTGVHLPAGSYEIEPFALASAAPTADVDYKLEVATDSLATRCALLTTGGYAEANDGANSTGNDMITISSGVANLTSANDTPEPSGITTSASSTNRISGSAANVTTADDYEDKDTYAFSTGSANELTLRLAWTGAANLDFYVYEAGTKTLVASANTTTAGAENAVFSLKPSSNYWLLVGALAGNTTGLPAPYSATLCGGNY